jgi:hypothetical protein
VKHEDTPFESSAASDDLNPFTSAIVLRKSVEFFSPGHEYFFKITYKDSSLIKEHWIVEAFVSNTSQSHMWLQCFDKIGAVKFVKSFANASLMEAKNACDAIDPRSDASQRS